MQVYKSYKKSFDYSYSFGAFPTIELIKAQPKRIITVIISSLYHEDGNMNLEELCKKNNIPIEHNDKLISRLSPKENCYVIGIFKKYSCLIDKTANHIALANPSNMGNLGTIIRTSIGFGIKNLAIIGYGADILDPKAVRASMGAIFRINFAYYDTIEHYIADNGGKNGERDLYPFMLDGKYELTDIPQREKRPYTLIFGNEAAGLDETYQNIGESVVIKHSHEIDSLNLSIAVGIALYQFNKDNRN